MSGEVDLVYYPTIFNFYMDFSDISHKIFDSGSRNLYVIRQQVFL